MENYLTSEKIPTINTKNVLNTLKTGYEVFRQHKVSNFVTAVEHRMDFMTENEIDIFLKSFDTTYGKNIISDFVNAIINSPSHTVTTALALLFVKDRDFSFSEEETERLVSCIVGLTEKKVNTFIAITKLKPINTKTIFNKYEINNSNFSKLNIDIDLDELHAYIAEFKNKGLLLSEPEGGKNLGIIEVGSIPNYQQWSLCFGISNILLKLGRLLEKAQVLNSLTKTE
ncbi:hypothetical protein [Photobacterium leiognathi]|uniref:hypothetical protein n=1 Tax=Photobacterium leiognathi TaxID=553611 RepID=UPI0029814B48|nr:hypothetical protein [Photobacterium leiognathi]